MRPSGRQIEHVARFEYPLLGRIEVGNQLERRACDRVPVPGGCNAPAALAVRLQQEDIVRIQMGSDAPAVASHADHQIIDPRVRNEAKGMQERMDRIEMTIDAVDQDRPIWRTQCRQSLMRSVGNPPLPRFAADQACLCLA